MATRRPVVLVSGQRLELPPTDQVPSGPSLALPANNIAVGSAAVFTKTITQATTLTHSGSPAAPGIGEIVLILTNGGAFTVTWWSGITWLSGAAPTLKTSGINVLVFFTLDGGQSWIGAEARG